MLRPHEHKKNHPGMSKGFAPDTILRPEAPITKHKSQLKSDVNADNRAKVAQAVAAKQGQASIVLGGNAQACGLA